MPWAIDRGEISHDKVLKITLLCLAAVQVPNYCKCLDSFTHMKLDVGRWERVLMVGLEPNFDADTHIIGVNTALPSPGKGRVRTWYSRVGHS